MSMNNRFTPHTVSEFFAWLAPFYEKARARHSEYLDHGSSDIDFNTRAVYEALMSFVQDNEALNARIDQIEKLLGVEANPKE